MDPFWSGLLKRRKIFVDLLYHSMKVKHRGGRSSTLDPVPFPVPSTPSANDTNLALGRPATQSSVSSWSNLPTPEADARGANNGKIDGLAGFHTDIEPFPWWQVDLQSTCLLRAVRLFNRQECAARLRHFNILSSIDGVNWLTLYRKSDEAIFGATDMKPYTAELPSESVGRFVRVQLIGKDCLHFCECEVLGTELEPARAKLVEDHFRDRLAEVERRDEAREAELRDGRQGHLTTIGSAGVFVDTDKYSALLIKSLTQGGYEARERELVGALLRVEDRVLEIGTAVGAVTMTAAKIVGAENVLTYEANPQIAADARRNFAYNDLAAIQARVGVLCNRKLFAGAPEQMEFFISRNFWASRLYVGVDGQDIVETVHVPTACLEEQISAHRATALICDIEGGEVELLTDADLTGIRLIIMETHNWAVGAKSTDAMMRALIVSGFNVDLHHSGNGIAVLYR
jgi:FkbM family methyltransferase